MYSGQDQFIALHLPLNFTTFALQYISRVACHSSATLYTVAYSSASGAAPLMYSGSDSLECSAVCSPIALHKFTAQNVLLFLCPAQMFCHTLWRSKLVIFMTSLLFPTVSSVFQNFPTWGHCRCIWELSLRVSSCVPQSSEAAWTWEKRSIGYPTAEYL